MKTYSLFVGVILFLQNGVPFTNAARILGIFPHPGKSHFDVFQPLLEGLAEKGHNVTVVGFFPHKNPPKGYHDISLVGIMDTFTNAVPMAMMENQPSEWVRPFVQVNYLVEMGLEACKALLPTQQIQALLKSKGEYDLVIIEHFNTECFMPIPYILEVPHIGISTCTMLPWINTRFANPQSNANNVFTGIGPNMDFIERFRNTLVHIMTSILHYPLFQAPAQKLVEQHIGHVPPLEAIARNSSLMLVNTHFTLEHPKPHQPATVQVGGMHVKPAKPLPQDLEEFISSAEHGVIVFSMGSILNAATFDQKKKEMFINVFRTLPQRVVWKISGELKNLPPNVKTMSWIPQRDVLAHPNVKAYLAHGGLLGLTEAMISGTPIVAIPMFGDQHNNVRTGVQREIMVELNIDNLSEEKVRTAIMTVLSDKYQKRAAEFAKEYNDRPMPPLDLAIYWVEYVLRHGGNSLRSPAINLTLVQYYLLDVIASYVIIIFIVFYAVYKCLSLVRGQRNCQKIKKQ